MAGMRAQILGPRKTVVVWILIVTASTPADEPGGLSAE
jgi:hypothetical protein